MHVEIRPHVANSLATRQPVKFGQYQIIVEDDTGRGIAGYVHTKPGSKILLIRKYTPLEVEHIEAEVRRLTKDQTGVARSIPDVPPEMLEIETDEDGLSADDLD